MKKKILTILLASTMLTACGSNTSASLDPVDSVVTNESTEIETEAVTEDAEPYTEKETEVSTVSEDETVNETESVEETQTAETETTTEEILTEEENISGETHAADVVENGATMFSALFGTESGFVSASALDESTMLTESEAYAEFEKRGFPTDAIEIYYSADGEMQDTEFASSGSSDKHPSYYMYFTTDDYSTYQVELTDGVFSMTCRLSDSTIVMLEGDDEATYSFGDKCYLHYIPDAENTYNFSSIVYDDQITYDDLTNMLNENGQTIVEW